MGGGHGFKGAAHRVALPGAREGGLQLHGVLTEQQVKAPGAPSGGKAFLQSRICSQPQTMPQTTAAPSVTGGQDTGCLLIGSVYFQAALKQNSPIPGVL